MMAAIKTSTNMYTFLFTVDCNIFFAFLRMIHLTSNLCDLGHIKSVICVKFHLIKSITDQLDLIP